MNIDLHMHSIYSDGQYSPGDLVKMSYEKGLTWISLTDHDSISGIGEALNMAQSLKLSFIPGIELSCQTVFQDRNVPESKKKEIHILGYGFKKKDMEEGILPEFLKNSVLEREKRAEKMASYLNSKGIYTDLDRVKKIAGKGSIGRPHFAMYMTEMGYAESVEDAFSRYLARPEFLKYTQRELPDIFKAQEIINSAGGVSFIAHPGIYKLSDKKEEALIEGLLERGLYGIEAFYSGHTEEKTRHYLEMAKKYGLRISAGSDFHGEKVKKWVPLGMTVADDTDLSWLSHLSS